MELVLQISGCSSRKVAFSSVKFGVMYKQRNYRHHCAWTGRPHLLPQTVGHQKQLRFAGSTSNSSRSPYEVLGLQPGASKVEIKTAYFELSKKHHPDRNPGDPSSAARFNEVAEAYDILSNVTKQSNYNRKTGNTRPPINEDMFARYHQSRRQRHPDNMSAFEKARWAEQAAREKVQRNREEEVIRRLRMDFFGDHSEERYKRFERWFVRKEQQWKQQDGEDFYGRKGQRRHDYDFYRKHFMEGEKPKTRPTIGQIRKFVLIQYLVTLFLIYFIADFFVSMVFMSDLSDDDRKKLECYDVREMKKSRKTRMAAENSNKSSEA